MCNLSPLLLGPVVMKSHVLTLWLWITIGTSPLLIVTSFKDRSKLTDALD